MRSLSVVLTVPLLASMLLLAMGSMTRAETDSVSIADPKQEAGAGAVGLQPCQSDNPEVIGRWMATQSSNFRHDGSALMKRLPGNYPPLSGA